MKKLLLLLTLTGLLSCARTGQQKASTGSRFDTTASVYSVQGVDTAMDATVARAQATLGDLDRALQSGSPDYSDFAVKKAYATPDKSGVHLWIAGVRLVEGGYRGFINNEAGYTTEVAYGDTVTVKREEVTDWMYLENNKLRGGYSIREILRNLNKEERKKMLADLGFDVEE